MNIWLINHYNMPPELGPWNRQYNFAKYLQRMGHAPVVFAGSKLHNTNVQMIPGRERCRLYDAAPFPYVFIRTCDYGESKAKRVFSMLEFYFRLLRCAKDFPKPDVVIGSSAHPLAALAALRLAKRYRCLGVVEVRDLWPESIAAYGVLKKGKPILKLLYQGEKWLYAKADRLIFTMEGGSAYLLEKGWDTAHGGPVALDKVYHVNNGVDGEVFAYNREHYTVQDADLADASVFKAVYVGSVRRVNHVQTLVDAAQILQENCPGKYKILVYGDGAEREALEREALERGVTQIVFKGSVEKKYVPYILSQADAAILHWQYTPIMRFGLSANKLFDYFAAGLPVISDLRTPYDLLERYGCGVTLDTDTAQSVAEGILRLAALPPAQYAQMRNGALQAAADYDFKNLTRKLAEVIHAG